MNIQTVKFQDISFINVPQPKEFEMKYLKNNYNFNSLHIDDYINKTLVPKVEVFKDYSLLVLDFPLFPQNGSTTTPPSPSHKEFNFSQDILTSIPSALPIPMFNKGVVRKRRILSSYVNFFIGKDYMVVIHEDTLPQINHIFTLCQKTLHNRDEFMGMGPVFLAYRIIDALVDSCFPVINEISATIDKIDKEIEYKQSQKTVEEISNARRNIVVFHTMVKPILPIFSALEEGKYKELNGTMQPYWGNILDHLQKIWDRLEDSRELIEGISESNESILSSKTNEIIKVLTIFSAVILPLNLLAGIYGMNIQGLPFADNPLSFWQLLSTMFIAGTLMLLVLKAKRWF